MKKIIFTILTSCIIPQLFAQNAKIDSLLKLLKTAKKDTNEVNILYQLSEESEDDNYVLDYAQKALQLAKKLNYKKGMANAYNNIGYVNGNLGNTKGALDFYNKSLTISEEIGDKQGIAAALSNIAIIYYIQGNLTMSLECSKRSIKISETVDNKAMIAINLNNIGLIYEHESNFELSLEYNFKSLKMREEIGDSNQIAVCLINIGGIYVKQQDFLKAKEYFIKSLRICEKMDNFHTMVVCLNNLGVIYIAQEDTSNALASYQNSLKICEKTGDKLNAAIALKNIGAIYLDQNNNDEALRNYQQSLEIEKKVDDKEIISAILADMGKLYFRQRNYIKAEKVGNESLDIATKVGSPERIRIASQSLSEIYSGEGKYENAFKMQVLFKQMADSVSNIQTRKSLVKKELQYEFEKKEAITKGEHEKERALANAEIKHQTLIKNSTLGGVGIIGIFSFLLVLSSNRKKKSIFEKQVSEVEMKALRSQMNPHFIFNALQSVNDFILKKDTMNASNFLIKFSKLMRSVLENSVHKEVTIERDMTSLELYMQLESSRLDFPFDYEIIIDPKIDPGVTFIPPLILQPFVENSIWHGLKHKKERGRIKIEIKEEGNSILCSIEDNGVGREKAGLLRQPIPEKRESLGMKLTKERLRILEQIKNFRSRIDVIDLKDAMNNPIGLRVELSLPLSTLN